MHPTYENLKMSKIVARENLVKISFRRQAAKWSLSLLKKLYLPKMIKGV